MEQFAVTPPRSRKPRGQGASRRAEILASATRLFLEEGVDHVTMRRIAQAVGVSPTALYVYFPDKAAIFLAIAETWFAELLEVLAASQRAGAVMATRPSTKARKPSAWARVSRWVRESPQSDKT